MQVVSMVNAPPAAQSVASAAGSSDSGQGSSFSDQLGTAMTQDTQTQQPDAGTQQGTGQTAQGTTQTQNTQNTQTTPQAAQAQQVQNVQQLPPEQSTQDGSLSQIQLPEQVPETSGEAQSPVEIQQDAINPQLEQSTAAKPEQIPDEVVEETALTTVVQAAAPQKETEQADSVSETEETAVPEAKDAEPEQSEQMIYLSPFLLSQLNLNTVTSRDGEEKGVTELAAAATGEISNVSATASTENTTAAAAIANFGAVITQSKQIEPQSEQTAKTTDSADEQTTAFAPGTQETGENLITRIAQAMLSQDTGDGSAEAEADLTPGENANQAESTPEELPVFTNTSSFTVNVQEGLEGKAAAVEEIIDRFAQDFKGAESCPGELNITLSPEDLGELKISIRMSESGGVSAHITAQDKEICSLVSSQIGRLVETMQQRGITVETVDVTYNQTGNQQNSGQSSYQEQNRRENSRYDNGGQYASDEDGDITGSDSLEQYVNTRVISTGDSISI